MSKPKNPKDGGKKAKNLGLGRFGDEQYANWTRPTLAEHLKKFTDPSQMESAYHPKYVEAVWDQYWENHGLYRADPNATTPDGKPKDTFVIVLPPPNVTGNLHLGHALTCSIQDTLVRWHRMKGKEALWVPGTDHAGIATQVVVEKRLMKEKGLDRHALGRTAFLEEVWKFKEAHENHIKKQLRRLGASLDWSRERFTLDDQCARAVMEAFVRLFDQGLIFRANRLVNWSCELQTAISEIEVDKVEITEETEFDVPNHKTPVLFGAMHYFKYPIRDPDPEGPKFVTIATTRVETMLGDVAVAINSQSKDAKFLIGKTLEHPYFPGRRVPIVVDDVLVDLSKGTGCVKITPAHDLNDFECAQRHNLPAINIFDEAGRILELGTPFDGMQRFDCRTAVISDLQEKGLYINREPYPMQMRICSRSKDIVEHVLRPQWWVKCEEMAQHALQASVDGKLTILPEQGKQEWAHWLGEIRDWCISRQLWWGHQIPAWQPRLPNSIGQPFLDADKELQSLSKYQQKQAFQLRMKKTDAEALMSLGSEDTKRWIVAKDLEDAKSKAAERFPLEDGKEDDFITVTWVRDGDVLDTWFSSGLWPFSVMGWPDNTPDMGKFFPGDLLETGKDILFFWVARMVMMSQTLIKPEGTGIETAGELPFHTVYLHSMVRDKDGEKMSKAKGNVVDPVDVMNGISLEDLHETLRTGNLDPRELEKGLENQKAQFPQGISECGADALRFGLLSYAQAGTDIKLDILRVVGYRQFCNKLWNIVRFALTSFPKEFQRPSGIPYNGDSGTLRTEGGILERWILHRVATAVRDVNRCLENYEFAEATQILYHLWLADISQVYVECLKPVLRSDDETLASRARSTLFWVLETSLRLLHPFMPFVTEELYHWLPDQPKFVSEQGGIHPNVSAGLEERKDGESEYFVADGVDKTALGSIMVAEYPVLGDVEAFLDVEANDLMEHMREIAHAGRSSLTSMGLGQKKVDIILGVKDPQLCVQLQEEGQIRLLETQLGASKVTVWSPEKEEYQKAAKDGSHHHVNLHGDAVGILIPLEEQDPVKESCKLERQVTRKTVTRLSTLQSCPPEDCPPKLQKIRESALARIETTEKELEGLEAALKNFRSRMTPEQKAEYIATASGDLEKEIKSQTDKIGKLQKKKSSPKNEAKIAGMQEILEVLQKQLEDIKA